MKTKKFSSTIYFVLIILTLAACKSKTALVKQPSQKIDPKLSEQIDRIEKAQPTFSNVYVNKMTAAIEIGGRKFNTQASCKIKTDSCIHVSIQPMLGIEMFKVEIDKDSMRVFDKFNKKMYIVAFSYFKQKWNVSMNFNDLQAMLSNQFFTVGSTKPNIQGCKQAGIQNNLAVIEYQTNSLNQKTKINTNNRIAEVQIKAINADYKMDLMYSDFFQLDKFIFPQRIDIDAKSGARIVKINFKISKAIFDKPLNFTSIDQSKFSKGDINQLMNK